MKKTTNKLNARFLKIAFLSATAVVLTLTLPSCSNPKPEDTKEVAEDQNDAKFSNAKEDDANFLVDAAEIHLQEMELGKLAQTRATTSSAKDLAKMMETEHSKALSDLQGLAAKKQITIPTTLTDDGMSANKKLMDIKGSKFDKEYADMMVDGHKDAISTFEKASTNAQDEDIRNWATSMLPTLRKHLDQSIMCQKECEKM